MTPEQTTTLIAIVTRYQQADLAFMADGSRAHGAALAASLAELLDWKEAPPWTTSPTASNGETRERPFNTPGTSVGCEDADGLLRIHPEAETCAVCAQPTPGSCGTCAHFWPWDRATLTGTGDCHHPAYRGRRNGLPDDDGCLKGYMPKATAEFLGPDPGVQFTWRG